jgi:DNA primase
MITKIKDKLYNNEDKIRDILEDLDCTYIKKSHINGSPVFKFGHDKDSSGNANYVRIDTLYYRSFSESTQGDIIILVEDILKTSRGKAIKWLTDKLGLKFEYTQKEVKLPFQGFWKQLSKIKDSEELESPIYPIERNKIFSDYGISKLFIKDGISALTQEEFGIGYSLFDNRITIPWFNYQGDLIGIVARINKKELTKEEYKYKYFPEIAFNKGKHLYGFYQNYKGILESNTIIICESEKSVLKGRELGYKNIVALGCNNITDIQAKLIKSTCCNVILALDEGISMEHCIEQVKKCQIVNPFFSNELYIVDMNRETNHLIQDEKVCIFDLNEETVQEVLKDYLIYID